MTEAIRVNQVGFLPGAPKRAVFPDAANTPETFRVVNVDTGEVAFKGALSAPIDNPGAGEVNRVADFSALTAPGRYRIEAGGLRSPEFAIDGGVYDALFRASVKMLYLQRCGVALDAAHAGDYAHPPCHDSLATIYGTNEKIDVSGGWHDAGDYGRYIVPGSKVVADLLLAHEAFGVRADDIGTPESGDGLDDLLQEAKFELDWMLKMQAPSGGVYHKVTCKTFPGFVMPQEERAELVVCPISNAATGDFAAVMAMASRLYAADWPQDAARYLAAAKRAWVYLDAHRGDPGFKNPADVATGEYDDAHDEDEYFWAAAELLCATGEAEYRRAAAEYMSTGGKRRGLGWEDVGTYGILAIVNNPALAEGDPLRQAARDELEATLREALALIEANPYGADRALDYEWGSNMGVANTGALLLMASKLLGDASLAEAAQHSLDYLLGRNATGYCFVTGFGAKSPLHPHHRPSVALGRAMPGMLVGGPDNGLHDPAAQAALAGAAPAKCYVDDDQSYSTNEICVYWNSPLILLLAGIRG
ncbi:MAG: glycoside hydrolase family 9 protein [Clostridia bacterium]|nr:glycoside hydrolase family 9 protein [Clostridia bacterium]